MEKLVEREFTSCRRSSVLGSEVRNNIADGPKSLGKMCAKWYGFGTKCMGQLTIGKGQFVERKGTKYSHFSYPEAWWRAHDGKHRIDRIQTYRQTRRRIWFEAKA